MVGSFTVVAEEPWRGVDTSGKPEVCRVAFDLAVMLALGIDETLLLGVVEIEPKLAVGFGVSLTVSDVTDRRIGCT